MSPQSPDNTPGVWPRFGCFVLVKELPVPCSRTTLFRHLQEKRRMSEISIPLWLFLIVCVWQSAQAFPLQHVSKRGSCSTHTLKLEADIECSHFCPDEEPSSSERLCESHAMSRTASRRGFLQCLVSIGPTMITLPVIAATPRQPTNVFADKNFSIEDAKKRFQDARQDLNYLLDNYSDISKNGKGDAVRNYLGTQGINSNLYGIQKVLKILADAAEDIVEYTESMEEFNAYYYQAEGAAYQSMFIEHSSAKGSPELFLATAKQDIIQMQKCMDQLARQLNL